MINLTTNFESRVSNKPAALVIIDIQDFHGMSAVDARNFREAMEQRLTQARQIGQPIIWVAIEKGGYDISLPGNVRRQMRDPEIVRRFGFHTDDNTQQNNEIYREFIRIQGPTSDDVICRKPFMSAFVEPQDFATMSPQERAELLLQAGFIIENYHRYEQEPDQKNPSFTMIEQNASEQTWQKLMGRSDAPTLVKHLRQQGIDSMEIIGAVSKYCVSESALTAIAKGFDVTIDSNLVLSWQYHDAENPTSRGQLVWRDGMSADDHAQLIRSRLASQASVVLRSQTAPSSSAPTSSAT